MNQPPCRWGILGTATIAQKNWQGILNSGNSQLVAVASRNPDRAAQFIATCQADAPFPVAPRPCDYEALLASSDIDAVYIPLPTGIRKAWVERAAAAGKHVLCEKPCAVTAADLTEMLSACQKHKVQFMDGVMFMHSRRLERMRGVLDDGQSVGAIKRITSQFSFLAPEEFLQSNIRVSSTLEPLGCLGDLGWYNIRFAQWALGGQMPERVSGRILTATSGPGGGVPLEFSGELFFPHGVSASFYCSFLVENQQWANISGTKGTLSLNDFVLPFFGCEAAFTVSQAHFDQRACHFNMGEHTQRYAVREYSNNAPGSQETNMFQHFSANVLARRSDDTWGRLAWETQTILDACLASAQQHGALVTLH